LDEKDLLLNISHSGGCQEREYELFLDPLFCATPPVYLTIRLSHNSNNDLCEAWITKNLCFDISSIYNDFPEDQLYIEFINYPHQSDTIWLFLTLTNLRYLFKSAFTVSAINLPSALPASSLDVTPITFPISAGPEAPTFSIMSATALSNSSVLIC